jgi:hypothetical protein
VTAPRVGVRFEAEGTDPVVAAIREVETRLKGLQQTQRQGTAAAEAQARGLGALVAGVKNVAGALGAVRVAAFVRDSLQAADAIGKLAQATGVAAEPLSALALAARKADVEQTELETGLRGLAKSLTELQSGNADTAASFQALGLSAKDLAGLSLDQALVRVADAQARYTDGAEKAVVAGKIFGDRVGLRLLPLLNDLADGGFARATEEARRMGVLFSSEATQQAQAFNDSLTDLGTAAQGLAAQFGAGLAPSVTAAVGVLTAGADQARGPLETLGRIAGGVTRTVVTAFDVLGNIIATSANLIVVGVRTAAAAKDRLLRGDFRGIGTEVASGFAQVKAVIASFNEDRERAGDFLLGRDGDAAGQDEALRRLREANQQKREIQRQATRQQQQDADRAAQARSRAEQQATDDALRLTQRRFQLEEAQAQRAYAQGLTSLGQFYAERRRLIEAEASAELQALQAKRAALLAQPARTEADRTQRAAALAQVDAQIQERQLALQGRRNDLLADELAERERLRQAALQFEAQIREAQGQTFQLRREERARQVAEFDRVLAQQGDPNRAAKVAQFQAAGETRIRLDELAREAAQVFDALDREQARIAALVQSGTITEEEGRRRVLALERERLPGLLATRQALVALQQATEDPAVLDALQQQIEKIDELARVTQQTQGALTQLGVASRDALESGLESSLAGVLNQTRTFGDVWRDTARSVLDAVNQIIARLIALQIQQAIVNAAGSLLGFKDGGAVPAPIRRAGGGFITGPGTATSDSILARLSAGEYVMRAAAVRAYGVDFFEALNGLRAPNPPRRGASVPRFAEGGLVGTSAPGGETALVVGLEDGLVARKLETTEGTRSIIRVIERNANTIRRALRL